MTYTIRRRRTRSYSGQPPWRPTITTAARSRRCVYWRPPWSAPRPSRRTPTGRRMSSSPPRHRTTPCWSCRRRRCRRSTLLGSGIHFGKKIPSQPKWTNFGKFWSNFGLNSLKFRDLKHKIHFGPNRNRRISLKFVLSRSNPISSARNN